MQEPTEPSGIAIALALVAGLALGCVGAFYAAKAMFRARVNDNFTICAAIGIFFLGFMIPPLFILNSSPKKPGQVELEKFQAAKKEAEYWGAQMLKQVKAGQEELAQDSSRRYSAAKEQEDMYWRQYVAEINRTNLHNADISTNTPKMESTSP